MKESPPPLAKGGGWKPMYCHYTTPALLMTNDKLIMTNLTKIISHLSLGISNYYLVSL